MNPFYSSPKGITNQRAPTTLYNQKDKISSFQPSNINSKITSTAHSISPVQTSKNFITKPSLQLQKGNSIHTGYHKLNTQASGFQANPIAFQPPKNHNDVMKNLMHGSTRASDTNHSNKDYGLDKSPGSPITPRRQPRYSEPAQLQSSYQSTQDVKTSFFAHSKSNVEQKQTQIPVRHFYKKQTVNFPETSKQDRNQKGRDWFKQPSRVKKTGKELDDFQMIKCLGKGKYGSVFLARDKKSRYLCALKMIEKAIIIQENIMDQFIRQVKIQMFLNHPHVIKMYGCFDDEKNIYIILEVVTGGQLFQLLRKNQPLPQAKVAALMKQICAAVDELHASRIIHRDIKPENIVMHEGIAKLCDFGWSVHLDNKMRSTFCGTPLYVCPQILKGNEYDQKIDIWSLGIMMYEMLVGQNPFKINKQEELIKIVKEEISIPSYVYVSKQARDFLDKCLQKNPNNRVNIKELINHEFILKNADKGDKKVTL